MNRYSVQDRHPGYGSGNIHRWRCTGTTSDLDLQCMLSARLSCQSERADLDIASVHKAWVCTSSLIFFFFFLRCQSFTPQNAPQTFQTSAVTALAQTAPHSSTLSSFGLRRRISRISFNSASVCWLAMRSSRTTGQ